MSTGAQDVPEEPEAAPRLTEEMRRRLDAVFGDVLPSTTSDERDPGSAPEPSGDERYLADRPPHHDRER